MEALANTTAAEIANALNGAAADWKTQTSVRVGDTSKSDEDGKGEDGCVVTISQATADVSSVVIPSGAQVTVDPIAPSVQRELENIATYTQIIFEVPVTVQAEAVLTLNADVVFCDEVTVEGTLIINGMAFNQGAMQVSNANNTHAEIKSEGVVVNGSLNNDAARGLDLDRRGRNAHDRERLRYGICRWYCRARRRRAVFEGEYFECARHYKSRLAHQRRQCNLR